MLFMWTYIFILLQYFWCYQNVKTLSKSCLCVACFRDPHSVHCAYAGVIKIRRPRVKVVSVVLVSGTHILTTALIPVLSKYEDPRVVSPPCLSAMRSEPSKGFSEGLIYDLHWNTIIIKRISGAPIYRTRWEHRALYNNTNNTHAHTHTHTHIHACMHTHMHAHVSARTHTDMHTHKQTNMHQVWG